MWGQDSMHGNCDGVATANSVLPGNIAFLTFFQQMIAKNTSIQT
jgi:hypothetical protein